MRIAAFRCVRRPQIWTPRQKYYQKMYSHIHYRLQKPEKHFWLFQLARFFQKKAQCVVFSLKQVHVTKIVVYCDEMGLVPVHSQSRIIISTLNHLLLVLNSSVNFIIYCFLGNRSQYIIILRVCSSFYQRGCRIKRGQLILMTFRFRRSLIESVGKMMKCCYKYDELSPTSIRRTETRNTETSFVSKYNKTSRQQHSNISNSLDLH